MKSIVRLVAPKTQCLRKADRLGADPARVPPGGHLSIAEIARQSGITGAIQKRAKRDGWAPDLLPAVQAEVKDENVGDTAPAGALEAEAVDAAAWRLI